MKAQGKSLVAIVIIGAAVAAFRLHEDRPIVPHVSRAPVSRGDVVQIVTATGTLAPARTVAVGAQVTGTVTKLLVDYNSIVKKGQVLATIDPDRAETQLEVAQANSDQVKTSLVSDDVRKANDELLLSRMETLVKDQQETAEDRDAAALTVEQDNEKIAQDKASITIAQTVIDQAKLQVNYCTITSPIDGVVVARDVDEGQTVNASVIPPTIYELASDLTTLLLYGSTDEADVAKLHEGQAARFTVDSYPGVTFTGKVRQIRLNATTVNNVVTYQSVIDVNNPDLRLRPGMTAHFTVETGRSSGVLRVPSSALRFNPNENTLTAYPETTLPKGATPVPTIAEGSMARVWKVDGKKLVPVAVKLGRSDGNNTEIASGDLTDQDEVVTAITVTVKK